MKILKSEIKWALIYGLSLLMWMILERAFGLHDRHIAHHSTVTSLFLIVVVIIYVMALLEKRRKTLGGIMTYKQGLISGLTLTGFIMLLSPILQLIISGVITPDYFDNVINYAVDQDLMTEEAAKSQFNLNNYLIQSVVGAAIIGVLLSLILPIFLKKSPQSQ